MKAIIFEEFGGPEVLRLADVDEPHAGPGMVRIAIRAIGVNPYEYKLRNGWMESFFRTTLPATPGAEVAGVVDEIGDGVTDFAIGDAVLGWCVGGSYAEYALAGTIAPKPPGLTFTEAAALPIAGDTARRGLDALGVRTSETLLVHGAAGAVGSVAGQLAVARGARVIGTAGERNHDRLRELGILPVRYGDGLVERVRELAPDGVDAVFDAAGRGALPESLELRGGTADRVITIADPDAATYGVTFVNGTADSPDVLAEQARMVADGKLRLTVAGTFPLADAAKAQQLSETGHAGGKLVLIP